MEKADASVPTFGQLREMLPRTAPGAMPRPGKLKRSDEEVLMKVRMDGEAITVFRNGLILFEADGHGTVFTLAGSAAHAALNMKIDEESCGALPWYIPVALIGEDRLRHNADSREDYRIAFRAGDLRIAAPERIDEKESMRRREEKIAAVREAMDGLSGLQREVARLRYEEKMSQKDIAAILGITQQAVSCHIEAIEKKFLKKCKKFLRKYL